MRLLVLLLACVPAFSQIFTLTREQLLKYTAQYTGERFDSGRPKVPAALLEKAKGLSVEEAPVGQGGYSQYEGNWQILHPERKLVGRAVTAQFLPIRDDLNQVIVADGKARGAQGSQNQWVIDTLEPGDVLVVDLGGRIEYGGFVGDNLATAIFAATKAGFVIDGAIRDLEGIFPIPMGGYYRAAHPAALRGVMLTGVNIPIRVGGVTVMPGDVVLGDREGVTFIPPHLLEKMLARAEDTHIHDEWTKQKFMTGKYKSSELYSTPRDPELRKEYEEYRKKRLEKK